MTSDQPQLPEKAPHDPTDPDQPHEPLPLPPDTNPQPPAPVREPDQPSAPIRDPITPEPTRLSSETEALQPVNVN